MKTIKVTDIDLIEQIRSALPETNRSKSGLLANSGFLNLGVVNKDLSMDNIGNGYGYSYQLDGTGIPGPFISVIPANDMGLQIKSAYDSFNLYYRTKNPSTGKWTNWRKITTSAL